MEGVTAAMKPTILILCTGNICRSPTAALLLTHLLGAAADQFHIHTAGTGAVEGAPMDSTIGGLLHLKGVEATHSSSRKLSVGMVESADLVLTASTNQRAAVAKLRPAAVRKTMTLKQLARYAPFILEAHEPPPAAGDRICWILAGVPQARAHAIRRESDSVADPTGKSVRHYRAALQELERACGLIAPLLQADLAHGDPDPIEGAPREVHPFAAAQFSSLGHAAVAKRVRLGMSGLTG